MDIRWFDQLESTNQYCKLLDPNGVEEFTVVCARSQTAGIGQQGNTWTSAPGQNLTFSLILKPRFLAAADQYRLTMMLAVAVAETTHTLLAAHGATKPINIKWPNDIYVGDRKICGILTTCQVQGGRLTHAICGIGLNANQTTFPDWVPNPTSLKLESGHSYPLEPLLDTLLASIERHYRLLQTQPDAIRSAYLSRLYRLGQQAPYEYLGQLLRATITGISPFGQLLLHTDDGNQLTCNLKEVKYC